MAEVVRTEIPPPGGNVPSGSAAPGLIDVIVGFAPYIIILLVVFLAAYLFMRWWMKGQEDRKQNVFKEDFEIKARQCKQNANKVWLRPRFFGKISNGIPIKLVSPATKDRPAFTKIIGKYLGHSYDQKGWFYLLFGSNREKILGIIPKIHIIATPREGIMEVENPKKEEPNQPDTLKIHLDSDPVIEGDEEIQIIAKGLQYKNYFYYPVLYGKTNKGQDLRFLDNSLLINQREVYAATDAWNSSLLKNFVRKSEEGIKIDPDYIWTRDLEKTPLG